MANQDALQEGNQVFTLMGATGTAGTAQTRRVIVDDNGNIHVASLASLVPYAYDSGTVTYPDGTTEVYTFGLSGVNQGTVTLVYTDSTKGSLSTFSKS